MIVEREGDINKKITEFPQIYQDGPCSSCITLSMCMNKDAVSIAQCPYVGDLLYSEANLLEYENPHVLNLNSFPSYSFLFVKAVDGDGVLVRVLAYNLLTDFVQRAEVYRT